MQLAAFQHIDLKAGQSARVNLTFDKDALALRYYDEKTNTQIRVPGIVKVMVGASAADIRLTGEVNLKNA